MSLVDYYAEYGLPSTDSLAKIQVVIDQMLTDEQHDRQSEGHAERQAKLEGARKAFQSEDSRQRYDQALAQSRVVADPDAQRKAQFAKWYRDAVSYFDAKEFDFAKKCIDHAFANAKDSNKDCKFYITATKIYAEIENFDQALDYANEAIVHNPDYYLGHKVKKVVLDRAIRKECAQSYPQREKISKWYAQLEVATKDWRSAASKAKNEKEVARSYGFEALIKCRKYPCQLGRDDARSEQCALNAYRYDKDEKQSKKIIDSIISRYEARKQYQDAIAVIDKQIAVAKQKSADPKWQSEKQSLERRRRNIVHEFNVLNSAIAKAEGDIADLNRQIAGLLRSPEYNKKSYEESEIKRAGYQRPVIADHVVGGIVGGAILGLMIWVAISVMCWFYNVDNMRTGFGGGKAIWMTTWQYWPGVAIISAIIGGIWQGYKLSQRISANQNAADKQRQMKDDTQQKKMADAKLEQLRSSVQRRQADLRKLHEPK